MHGHYWRCLGDLPCFGRPVVLFVRIRRFRCLDDACPRHTFGERLPRLARPRARHTDQLRAAHHAIALASGAQAGARLATRTGMPVGDLFPGTIRLLTPFLSITGALALVLGAVFSTYVFMPKRRVLILCTGNSARSQMAEGLLRHDRGNLVEVASAGTHPTAVRPEAIAVMREIGIDISAQRSKHVDELRGQPFDDVLTVCDADGRPYVTEINIGR